MTEDQLVSEALQLVAAEDYVDALPLWKKARDTVSETIHKCIYLLHEARCLRALKECGLAEQRLQMVEEFDREKKLQLELEHARVRKLYDLERYSDANDRSKRLLEEHAREVIIHVRIATVHTS
jgi:thioredoxin-like negative regulator of GroEL